jgi:hypothetical protein
MKVYETRQVDEFRKRPDGGFVPAKLPSKPHPGQELKAGFIPRSVRVGYAMLKKDENTAFRPLYNS